MEYKEPVLGVAGTRDFPPPEMEIRNWLFGEWRKVSPQAAQRIPFRALPVRHPTDLQTEVLAALCLVAGTEPCRRSLDLFLGLASCDVRSSQLGFREQRHFPGDGRTHPEWECQEAISAALRFASTPNPAEDER